MTENHPTVLLEEANPYKTRVAQLESDGRTVYLYLSPVDDLPGPTHAVWVRNLIAAPEKTDHEAMKQGIAPLQKKSACRHPQGAELPDPKELDLVWFPEGTGVSLYYQGRVEAIIPPYAGADGIQGYSREALELDVMTLPLPEEGSGFYDRLEENLAFWSLRARKETWPSYRDALLAHYEAVYGRHLQYYALSRDYPPMAIVEFPYEPKQGNSSIFPEADRIFVSLGMSYQPMPALELARIDAPQNSRMEFVTLGPGDYKQLPGILGRMAIYPWLSGSFFSPEHRYESGSEYEKSDYLFSQELDYLGLPPMEPFRLNMLNEDRTVRFLAAVAVNHEDMLVAQVKGVDFALKKMQATSGA